MFWIHFLELCRITTELGTITVTDATGDVYRAWIVQRVIAPAFGSDKAKALVNEAHNYGF